MGPERTILYIHLLSNVALIIASILTNTHPTHEKLVYALPAVFHKNNATLNPKSRNTTGKTIRQKKEPVNFRFQEKRILDNILGAGVYDKRIRPQGKGMSP